MWKTTVARLGLVPENGVEVIATGRVTAYGERSSYQLVIERMEYAGAGALLARIEMLRQRLAAEGLFEPTASGLARAARGDRRGHLRERRRAAGHQHHHRPPLPAPHPGLAGAGAGRGRGDADRRRHRRLRRHAAGGVLPRPDVLIVARGGGSLEDLMAFNEEAVLRAAAACRIPLISAVGHETDTTLIDFVSDRRAPTPTAAAELAVPSRVELLADLAQEAARLVGALHRLAQERRLRLRQAERGLPDLPTLLGGARQRLDDRASAWTSLAQPAGSTIRRPASRRTWPPRSAGLTSRRTDADARRGQPARARPAEPGAVAGRRVCDGRVPSARRIAARRRRARGDGPPRCCIA